MTIERNPSSLNRRRLVGYSIGAGAFALLPTRSLAAFLQETGQAITPETWTSEFVREQAGTIEVNTAEEVYQVVPKDTSGKVSFWYVGPNEASPELEKQLWDDFFAAFKETYPNIELETLNLDYNQMLDKTRTAALGGAAPCVARMPILWGVEFAAADQLAPIDLADFNYTEADFWPGALKSVTWDGQMYGIPTNNETMALIWNKQIFEEAGLDPERPPATWEELVEYSNQIKQETGKAGYGLVARVNAGNTPFRFMPVLWAYGAGALDEAEDNPTYEQVMLDTEAAQQALQVYYDLYVRDQSVPVAALTNTQAENQDPFIAGELGMVISHPSEYAVMVDRATRATGPEKELAQTVVDNMAYGLIPEGPERRAVVFGGSNVHRFKDEFVGGECDPEAARALMTFMTGPEWSTKLAWLGSNPGNLRGFKTTWMEERLNTIPFLDVTTAMLPYGVPFPVIPESTEIMNIIIPEMIQNALTEQMTVEEATQDAAEQVVELLDLES